MLSFLLVYMPSMKAGITTAIASAHVGAATTSGSG